MRWMAESPWNLPSTRGLLEKITAARGEGGCWVVVDQLCPSGLIDALQEAHRTAGPGIDVRVVDGLAGARPLSVVSGALGRPDMDVASLASDHALTDHVVIVDLREADAEAIDSWVMFLKRMVAAAAEVVTWAVVVVSTRDDVACGLTTINGTTLVRRLDSRIWAALRLPSNLVRPVDLLAEALAVELSAGDVDFISRLVSAGYDALLDPKSYFLEAWKKRCETDGKEYALASFELAVWKAQLQALFPWLEELRHEVVRRHGRLLTVEEAQKQPGVQEVANLELGAIAHQLSAKVPVHERDYLWSLARVRNALAHRRIAEPARLDVVIKASPRYGAEGAGREYSNRR